MTTVEPIRNIKSLRKLEAYLLKHSARDLLMFTIGTNCGLRISDIVALNVGDVRNKSHIQIIEKKTGKFKKFPVNTKLKPMFKLNELGASVIAIGRNVERLNITKELCSNKENIFLEEKELTEDVESLPLYIKER